MASPVGEKVITEALSYKNAIFKFISPNDVNATGAHQTGFYMPKGVWEMYTPNPPQKGVNSDHPVRIEWQNGLVTESVIYWYGKAKSEYRLTRFGRDFPYLAADNVGDLLVLIPKNTSEFLGYVLDLEEDIEEVLSTLGVQPFDRWAVYRNGTAEVEDQDECLSRSMFDFASKFTAFPSGEIFSSAAREILEHCIKEFLKLKSDEKLVNYYKTEYRLFQILERQICQEEIVRLFKDVDDFLQTAGSIMNRRKSRAGRSLENHIDYLLDQAKVPHDVRPTLDGRPDIVIPSKDAYLNSSYPIEKLFVVGVKTTCKDRWRQVLNEGKRVKEKYILTLQPGISKNQLNEMHKASVSLVVPKSIQNDYPKDSAIKILGVEDFISEVNEKLAISK